MRKVLSVTLAVMLIGAGLGMGWFSYGFDRSYDRSPMEAFGGAILVGGIGVGLGVAVLLHGFAMWPFRKRDQ